MSIKTRFHQTQEVGGDAVKSAGLITPEDPSNDQSHAPQTTPEDPAISKAPGAGASPGDPADPTSLNDASGAAEPSRTIGTFGHLPIIYDPQNPNAVAIASKTLIQGSPETTIDGTRLHLQSNGLVIGDTSTLSLSKPQAIPVDPIPFTTIANRPIIIASSHQLIVDHSTTLSANGPVAIIAGTTVSVAPNGRPVIGGSTLQSEPAHPLTTVNGQQIATAPSGAVLVGSKTISIGRPAVTISSTPYTLAADGNLVAGTSTVDISSLAVAAQTPDSDDAFTTINDQTIATVPSNALVIASHTISPGGPAITISGTVYSIAADGDLIAGTRTYSIDPAAAVTYSALVIDGQTITPGEAATISGTRIFLENGDSALVIGSKTLSIPRAVKTGGSGELGGYILSGLGGNMHNSSSIGGARAFTGGGPGRKGDVGRAKVLAGFSILAVLLLLGWFTWKSHLLQRLLAILHICSTSSAVLLWLSRPQLRLHRAPSR